MDIQKAWQTVLGQLQMEMPRASYDTWVRDTKALSYEDGCLTIGVRNAYARDWLESRLTSTVSRLLIGIMNRTVDVDFILSQPDLEDNNFDGECDTEEPEIKQEEEPPQNDSPAITAISLEDYKLMDRVVVLPGYMQRLAQDIGVKGIWLYAAQKQAFFMAGSGKKQGDVTRRVTAKDVAKWAIFSESAYWRILKKHLPEMGGLLERVGADKIQSEIYRRDGRMLRRRMPHQFRLYLTPRLARTDAAFLFFLLKDEKAIKTGLRRLIRMTRKDLINILPLLGSKALDVKGVENMNFVSDIVRALTGEEGELLEELEQLSNKLHLKIIKLWGTMHLSHYFLYRLIPERGLTAHQAWLLAVARDRAYINSRTGEMRSEIKFSSYEEMATLCGMASWKGIATWLRPYQNKRGGNLEPFMQEIDSPDDKYYDEIGKMERRFWVQLDDEELSPQESIDKFLEESNDKFPEESIDKFGESIDKFPVESIDKFGNSAHIIVLKENTINTEKSNHKKPPTTRSSALGRKAGGGGIINFSSDWDMSLLLKLNPGENPNVRKRIKSTSDPVALVSWLLYAYSAEGEGIRSPSVFALSKLKANPERCAPGIYKSLAKLGPDQLKRKIQSQLSGDLNSVERFLEGGRDTSGWSKAFGSASDEVIGELEGRLFDGDRR
jgi:hypothetical protein